MTPRRQQTNPVPRSRSEFVAQVKRESSWVGGKLDSILLSVTNIWNRCEKAAEKALAYGSGSIAGSVVQVPRSDPAAEEARDFLDLIDRALWALRTNQLEAIEAAIKVLPKVPRA